MTNFNKFVKEQLERPEVAREYRQISPFYKLANQLLLLRKMRGLSQQELADKAQTTQAVISRLENASVRCSLQTVMRLADALDAAVDVRLIPIEELSEPSHSQELNIDSQDINPHLEEKKHDVIITMRNRF